MKQEDFYRGMRGGAFQFANQNNRIRLALDVFSSLKIRSLLDFGCGDGSFLLKMKEVFPDLKVAGIDISPEVVQLARERGLEVHQHNLDQGKTLLADHSFDACFLGEVIEHVFSPDDLLDEIKRVLVPGGWFFLTTPNLGAWFNRISLLLGYQPVYTEVSTRSNAGHLIDLPGQPAGHLRLFTHRALCELIRRSGMEIVQSHGIGLNLLMRRRNIWFYHGLNFLFSHPSWSSGLGILARTPQNPSSC